MTTTYYPFTPLPAGAPRFYVTFDTVYSMVIKWNVSAQRYYFDLYDPNGTWIVTLPLIETAANIPIGSWVYDSEARLMQITGTRSKWRPLGQIVDVTIEGADPTPLNGRKRVEVTGPSTRVFPMAEDPGQVTQLGSINHYVNLLRGYIPGWIMIYRNNQFEVSPDTGGQG